MKVRLGKRFVFTFVAALGWLVFSNPQARQGRPEISALKAFEQHRSRARLDPVSPPIGGGVSNAKTVTAPARPDAATKRRVQSVLGKLPLYFIENQGQLDERVAYYLQGRASSVYFSSQGLAYALMSEDEKPSAKGLLHRASLAAEPENQSAPQRWVVKLDFVGSNPNVKPKGQDPTQALVNYFKGPKEQWKTGVKTYGSVVYEELWPGIDLIYAGTGNRLKYTFMVKPGADPGQIKLAYRGATSVRLNDAGQLEVTTPIGGFSDDKPLAWQDDDRKNVDVAYALKAEPDDAYSYGFRVGNYDKSKPLVLDPVVLVYSSYLGGTNTDVACCIAVDGQGNAYLAGRTNSDQTTFPETVGPDASFNQGSFDAFVAKVNLDGTGLIYAGYIGGSGDDEALGIAVDGQGNAYVTGFTDSTQTTFPVTVGPDLISNGGRDAFVAKVNAQGTALVYCGYIGGDGLDQGNGIAVDGAGFAYVAGATSSTQTTFPETVGSLDTTYNGGSTDGFVAKVRADGTGLVYAGYIGGSANDEALGIALQAGCAANCNAYLTGFTNSDNFPFVNGTNINRAANDAFVAKVKADGSGLDYSGFIGGSGSDFGLSIAVDSLGVAYVLGHTTSNDFRVFNLHPIQPPGDNLGPNKNAYFITKVDSTGSDLVSATLLGGSPVEFSGANQPGHIAVDSAGNAYVTGRAQTSNFPVTTDGAFQPNFGGGASDAFVAKLDLSDGVILYSTFLGGSGDDSGTGIAVNGTDVYVTGSTTSSNFPTQGPFQLNIGGGSDAFVAKLNGEVPLQLVTFPLDLPSLPPLATLGEGYSGNIGIGGGVPDFTVTITKGSLPNGLFFASPAIHGSATTAGASIFTAKVIDQAGNLLQGQFDITVCDAAQFALFTTFPQVVAGESQPFVACAGTKPITFSIPVKNSGNPTITQNGVYTAGATSNVLDTVRVTDANNNFLDFLVQVVPPLQISPTDATLLVGTQKSFTATGGVGSKTFSIRNKNPSGTIDPLTGLYTAGASGGVTDTVRVADDNKHSADATVNIVDFPTVTIVATDDMATEEGTTTGMFTVTRAGSTASALTVNYSVGGSASAGSDYAALPGSVVIPSGQSSAQIVVTPVDDGDVEGDQTVIVTLTAGAGYTVGTPNSATVTIADNDVPTTVTIAATDNTATEQGPTTGTLTITRTGSTASALTVNYTVGGTATPGSDYQALSGGVVIPAGQASAAITITPIDDAEVEAGETVIATLTASAGYSVGTPSSATVTIADNDSAIPDTFINSGPAADSGGATNNTSATFTFTATMAGSTFVCGLDNAAFAACTSPKSYPKLKPGTHNFKVQATAGGVTGPVASFDWTIDTKAPNTIINSGPPALTNDPQATFQFSSDDTEPGGAFQCSVDGGAFAPCTNPFTTSPLADGKHAFQVKAVDAAGNADKSAAKTKAWTVDTTPPQTTITKMPANPTTSASAAFKFVSTEKKSTFQCNLDGVGFSPCKSGQSFSGLSTGAHNFQVRAIDAAGNVDPTPASFNWTIQ